MRLFVPILSFTLASAFTGQAITIRDDVSDADSQALGNLVGSAVGKLFTQQEGVVSGVLIDPRFVLTAAHVVRNISGQDAFTFTIGASTYQSVRHVIHPNNQTVDDGYDVAVIELDRAVPDVTPAALYTGSAEIGVNATIVGFGLGGTGTAGATRPEGIRRGATNTIDQTTFLTFTNGRQLFYDFDAPGAPLESRTGTPLPTGSEGLIAFRDSGGGVFGTIGGQQFLLGIHSFVASVGDNDSITFNYGDVGASTRVSSNIDFISSAIPEPSSALLAGLGLVWLGQRRRLSR
ncbi:MAG TPA: trypsin-like serine protease [Chthoniobacteraceae bacterium]